MNNEEELAIKNPTIRQLRKEVTDQLWLDWRWQMANRVNSVGEIERFIELTESEKEALARQDLFRVDITPYFLGLIDPKDPNCPVRRQVIPTSAELTPFEAMMSDSLAEDQFSPVQGLVHRYPDRVLMLVTTQCASYCRYCTRSRLVGDPSKNFSKKHFEAQIEYISQTPQVRDVLLSGGDPLVLPIKLLDSIIARLHAIPHVEIVRIGTRIPVFLPMRIDDEYCDMLKRHHPLWMNIHVNHPDEITPELKEACHKLSMAGIPLGNQAVLLSGINDSVEVQRELSLKLVQARVRPYYLYQCDLVKGAGHFRTKVSKGIEIIEGLRGHISGYAVPTYVIDAPHGGGKVPVQPNYIISMSEEQVVVRNYAGVVSTYVQPSET